MCARLQQREAKRPPRSKAAAHTASPIFTESRYRECIATRTRTRLKHAPPSVAARRAHTRQLPERPDLGGHALRQGRAAVVPLWCNPGNRCGRGVHLAFEQRF